MYLPSYKRIALAMPQLVIQVTVQFRQNVHGSETPMTSRAAFCSKYTSNIYSLFFSCCVAATGPLGMTERDSAFGFFEGLGEICAFILPLKLLTFETVKKRPELLFII